jgi:DNA-binding LytR/AlgR family response regulator
MPQPFLSNCVFFPECLFIKTNKKFVKIMYSDTICFTVKGKYVDAITTTKKYLILGSLHHFEQNLPPDMFVRIHRSHIISRLYTTEFDGHSVTVDSTVLPIGKKYRRILRSVY